MKFTLKYIWLTIVLIVALVLVNNSSIAQCNWTQVDFEGFEYATDCPDLIVPYNIFHPTPWFNGNQHSGDSYLYMNFINNLPAGTLVYERFYNVCPGQQYQISNWFQGVNNSFSNITFNIVDANGAILDTWSGASISAVWTNYISNVVIPTTTSISFQLISDFAPGNNDMAFDDLELSMCITPPFDDGTVGACGVTPYDLYNSLVSVTGTNGTWTGPSALANGYLGTFVPGTNATGMYTYTISNTAPCPDEVVTLMVNLLPDPDVDPISSLFFCGDYTLPPITGTNLTGAEAYYDGPNGTGNSYFPGDVISATSTFFIYDGLVPCTDEETFTVTIENPVIDLGPDLELCQGEISILDASFPNATYEWQDNSTGATIIIDSPGTYYVTTTIGICFDQDTIEVNYNPLPIVELGSDTAFCESTQIDLDVSNSAASYLWQDSHQGANYSISEPGQYFVTVTFDQTGCKQSDTIYVNEILLPILDFGNDTSICQNDLLKLRPFQAYADSLVWFNGDTDDEFYPIAPSIYHATAYNACGSAYDEIEILHEDCTCNIYIANAITPDGDGLNDLVDPVFSNCDLYNYQFSVMDRWGQIVHMTTDPEDRWDASLYNDQPYYSEGGIYIWVMSYDAVIEGEITSARKMGHISLIR